MIYPFEIVPTSDQLTAKLYRRRRWSQFLPVHYVPQISPHFKWVLIGPSRVLLWFRQRRGFAVPFLLAAFHGKLCYFLTSSSLSLGISQLYNIYRKTATFFEKSDSITLSGGPYEQTSPFPHSLLLPTGPDYRCLKIHPHPCLTAYCRL